MSHLLPKTAKIAGYTALASMILWLNACASTSGGYDDYGPGPIPAGMGRLWIDAGGINELNFYINDQATGQEVHSDFPRMSGSAPGAYETGLQNTNLLVDLPAGVYTVVVNTDIDDDVEIKDVEIVASQEKYVSARLGRFQVRTAGGNLGSNMPFLIMDYSMRTVLGRAMTTQGVRHFIVPEGQYKVRMENSSTGFDQVRPVEVVYGRPPTFVQIGEESTTDDQEQEEP